MNSGNYMYAWLVSLLVYIFSCIIFKQTSTDYKNLENKKYLEICAKTYMVIAPFIYLGSYTNSLVLRYSFKTMSKENTQIVSFILNYFFIYVWIKNIKELDIKLL
jgi:hypothetical protein